MNNAITKLHKKKCSSGWNRAFRVFFKPDASYEDFGVGMHFNVASVNRQTGEVIFILEGYDLSILDHDE